MLGRREEHLRRTLGILSAALIYSSSLFIRHLLFVIEYKRKGRRWSTASWQRRRVIFGCGRRGRVLQLTLVWFCLSRIWFDLLISKSVLMALIQLSPARTATPITWQCPSCVFCRLACQFPEWSVTPQNFSAVRMQPKNVTAKQTVITKRWGVR